MEDTELTVFDLEGIMDWGWDGKEEGDIVTLGSLSEFSNFSFAFTVNLAASCTEDTGCAELKLKLVEEWGWD